MINPYKKNDSILRANLRQPLIIQWDPKIAHLCYGLADAMLKEREG